MTDIIFPAYLFAFALGVMHAFEADHIAAVTSLVSRERGIRRSSLLGALWGLGHTTTLLLVGSVLLILHVSVPPELSALFETAVAFILIALGASTIRRVHQGELHAHTHTHGTEVHAHLHTHYAPGIHNHQHTTFFVGLVHGLAGSGALALAAVAASSTLREGTLFIVLFGVGSMCGMALMSALLGLIFRHASQFVRLHTALMVGSGILCIVIAYTLIPVDEFIALMVR